MSESDSKPQKHISFELGKDGPTIDLQIKKENGKPFVDNDKNIIPSPQVQPPKAPQFGIRPQRLIKTHQDYVEEQKGYKGKAKKKDMSKKELAEFIIEDPKLSSGLSVVAVCVDKAFFKKDIVSEKEEPFFLNSVLERYEENKGTLEPSDFRSVYIVKQRASGPQRVIITQKSKKESKPKTFVYTTLTGLALVFFTFFPSSYIQERNIYRNSYLITQTRYYNLGVMKNMLAELFPQYIAKVPIDRHVEIRLDNGFTTRYIMDEKAKTVGNHQKETYEGPLALSQNNLEGKLFWGKISKFVSNSPALDRKFGSLYNLMNRAPVLKTTQIDSSQEETSTIVGVLRERKFE